MGVWILKKSSRDELFDFILKVSMIVLFSVGAVVFSYPILSDSINNYYDQKMMSNYLEESNEKTRVEALEKLALLEAENKLLLNERNVRNIPGMGLVEDPFSVRGESQDEAYFRSFLLGSVYIPGIKVSLPLFSETNNSLLEKGATVLQGTSFPVGGSGSHSVITGHSGLPSKRLFTDLERVEMGDLFYVSVGDSMLAYKVISFNTVLPHETDLLVIEDDRDLVTLLTCVPYMVNTHRLLVTGERVPFVADEVVEEIAAVNSYHTTRVFWSFGALAVFLDLSGLLAYRKYRYYVNSKKVFPLNFGVDVGGSLLGLYSRWMRRDLGIKAVSDSSGFVDFGLVNGGSYWVNAKYRVFIRKGAFVVYRKDSLVKWVRVK